MFIQWDTLKLYIRNNYLIKQDDISGIFYEELKTLCSNINGKDDIKYLSNNVDNITKIQDECYRNFDIILQHYKKSKTILQSQNKDLTTIIKIKNIISKY